MTRAAWIGLGLLTAVLVVAVGVAAHAAPEPLANEVHVLEDDAQDEFYWYDGYDLHHLHAREAYDQVTGEEGLIFRFTLYGGFGPAEASDTLHVDLAATGADGENTVRWSTTDDHNWTASAGRIVVADVTEGEPPWTGVTANMQTFVPYEALGAAPGGTLEGITMRSLADEDLRDEAPGGIYLPNSGGAAEVPTESTRHVDALELTGPSGYIDVSVDANGTQATLTVENQLGNGQHVTVTPVETPGWNVTSPSPQGASVDANGSTNFLVTAEPTVNASEPLPLEVTTDLGGHKTIHLGVAGEELVPASTADEATVDPPEPPKESPGPGALAALVAVGLVAWTAARQSGS